MFGKQYLEILKGEQKVKVLKSVSQDFINELKETKASVKNWTEGEFREKLVNIQKYLGEMLKDPNLEEEKKKQINNLYSEIYELFLSGKEMEKNT